MKIFVICSKKFYSRVKEVENKLSEMGHEVMLPNCIDEPDTEAKYALMGEKEHQEFKARMFKLSKEKTGTVDAVLVLNYDKEKEGVIQKNYIGGATFLEMYDAFCLGKKIFLMNPIPDNILYDEIKGFNPLVINGDLSLIPASLERENFDLENYLMWLASFSETFPNFYSESMFAGDPCVTEEDRTNIKCLFRLYALLKEKCSDFIIDNVFAETINFKFDSVGYEINSHEDNGNLCSLKRVSLGVDSADYFDVENILYEDTPKIHINKPNSNKNREV